MMWYGDGVGVGVGVVPPVPYGVAVYPHCGMMLALGRARQCALSLW